MLDQNAILDANDVRRNPVHGLAEARKAPMDDHEIPFGHNQSGLVLPRQRNAFDQIEEARATRLAPPFIQPMIDVSSENRNSVLVPSVNFCLSTRMTSL